MEKERRLNSLRVQAFSLAVAIVMMLSLVAVTANAQRSRTEDDLSTAEIMNLSGRTVGEGLNVEPSGPLNLKSYRVEEVSLPRAKRVTLNGERLMVETAWRITVTGGPFAVRAMPAVIWIDGVAVGNAIENEDLSAISVMTYDRSLLREGAAIAVSYGKESEERMELPERLSLRVAR